MKMEYRFYSFVAHHYLSQLQCGLQTAHAVAEMSNPKSLSIINAYDRYTHWAQVDKTIIICGAGNHAGVCDVYNTVMMYNLAGDGFPLVHALFKEDEQSMNEMVTACGVLVPARFYEAVYKPVPFSSGGGEWVAWPHNDPVELPLTPAEQKMVAYLKSFRLA